MFVFQNILKLFCFGSLTTSHRKEVMVMRRFFVILIILSIFFIAQALAGYEITIGYFIPKDRSSKESDYPIIREKTEQTISFWREQAKNHNLSGYPRGMRDKDDQLVISIINGKNNNAYYDNKAPDNNKKYVELIWPELFEAGAGEDNNIMIAFIVRDTGAHAMGGWPVAYLPITAQFWPQYPQWGVVAHELGHCFGLEHENNAQDIMSPNFYEQNQYVISARAVEILRNSPYFNLPIEVKAAKAEVPPIELQKEYKFTATLNSGLNFFHLPVADPRITWLSDLWQILDSPQLLIYLKDQKFESYSSLSQPGSQVDIEIKPDTGLIILAKPQHVAFGGPTWQDTSIRLKPGLNLIGLPVADSRLQKFSDLAGLTGAIGVFGKVSDKISGWPGIDPEIRGGESLLVMSSQETTLQLSGEPYQRVVKDDSPLAAPGIAETISLEDLRQFGDIDIPVIIGPSSLPVLWGAIKTRGTR